MDLKRGARAIVVTVVCVGGAAGTAWAQGGSSDSYYYFLLGRHLEGDGDAAGALAALEKAAAADAKSAEIRAEIASLQLRRNQPEQAEQAAKLALTLDRDNFEANRILGYVYAEASRNEKPGAGKTAKAREAVPYLERAAAINPTDTSVNFRLGQMYQEAGDTAKAVQLFARVVDQNPDSVQARQTLAQAQASVKDYAGAVRTLEPIAEDEPAVLARIGEYQFYAGAFADAAATYTKALESQPTNKNLKLARIYALNEAKQFTQVAALAAEAARQHPDDSRFPRIQARALLKGGNSSRAIELLESTVKQFPRDSDIQLELANIYGDSGRGPDAEKVLRQVVEAEPGNGPALNSLGYMFAKNGRNLDEAITLVNRALKAEPNKAEYLDSLGWAHFKRGDLAEAEKYLSSAAQQLPDHPEILDHLGDLYARQGRWQDAIGSWTRALKDASPDDLDLAALQKKIEDARTRTAGNR